MATRFELVLHGTNALALRSAGEEALDEIERLEAQLSLFRSSSEIAHLNARAAREPVRVTPSLFALLQRAKRLSEETGGAFDVTVAPLVRCWGFMGGSGHWPAAEEIAAACAKVGMHLVHLNPQDFTVRFQREGVMLDLGAIGKGYAVECGVELLREAGVTSALFHGGTSSIYALGSPPDSDCWKVAISGPEGLPSFAPVSLQDESLAVSAVWGKSFEAQGKTFGHVLDPRTGYPADQAVLAAVVLPSATETDAFSTALLTLGPEGHDRISGLRPGMRTLVVAKQAGEFLVRARGLG